MNLSTARSMERGKEVGIRKSIGAYRSSLIYQFLGESMIIVLFSTIIAIVIVLLAMPYMDDLTGKQFELQRFITWQTVCVFLGITFLIGLLLIAIFTISYQSVKSAVMNPVSSLRSE